MSRAGEVYTGFRSGDLRERDHWEDLGTEGRTVLKWIFKNWNGKDMEWIDLPQDRGR
jgi:hypothetical protein